MLGRETASYESGFFLIPTTRPSSCGIRLEHSPDLITHPAKNRQSLLLRSHGVGRIIEPPMITMDLSRKHRAGLVRISAHRDDRLHFALEKLIHMLRPMPRNIDSDFTHHPDRHRMHITRRLRPRALHIKDIPGHGSQNSLRQMTAAGIPRTQN